MNKAGIPFRAALFDLDGTLLDSLHVWQRVDAAFFGARGIEYDPERYSHAVQGMSFREAAVYTAREYALSEDVDVIVDEWTRLSAEEYAHRVPMKKGAREYLRMLRRAGVRLAVATANRRELFAATLENAGVAGLFDAVCTTAEAGDSSKRDGALFLLAARKLGVEPSDCAVFEDVPDGIIGAKAAGMRAFCVRDVTSRRDMATIEALADGVIDDFDGMRAFHAFPDNRRRCVVFAARCDGDPRAVYAPKPDDAVLCADGGWMLARAMGVEPDEVIGDFDSSDPPEGLPVTRVPREKDDTDTLLCLKRGLALGLEDFLIVGGFGGRVDHTLANLQALHYAARRGARCEMRDGASWATVVVNGAIEVPARPGKLSVFALGDVCRGVTLSGTKYDMIDAELTDAFPLGVSNEFTADRARIAVRDGALLVVACAEGEA